MLHQPSTDPTLRQRLRRWPNVGSVLGYGLASFGISTQQQPGEQFLVPTFSGAPNPDLFGCRAGNFPRL